MIEQTYDIIKYLKIAASVAEMGLWVYDVESKTAHGDEVMCNMYGIHPPNQEIDADEWFNIVHIDDVNEVKTRFNKSISTHEQITYNYRIVNKETKEVRHIQCLTFVIFDQKTNIAKKVIGINLDCTVKVKLEENIQFYIHKLEKIVSSIIDTISIMGELRDPYTAGHEMRVANLAVEISKSLNLGESQITCINIAARVHDIGKFWIPTEILTKPGTLLPVQFELIKLHPKVGYNILKNVEFPWPIDLIVLQHHERLDGSGYPLGLTSKDIKLESKIIAVADVIESVMSHRPYRPALGLDVAINIINSGSGKLFDPEISNICIDLFTTKNYTLPEPTHDLQEYEI
jgi:HD-GYP domain-containing protein (c-di-GMP phosphodiesterase class II)